LIVNVILQFISRDGTCIMAQGFSNCYNVIVLLVATADRFRLYKVITLDKDTRYIKVKVGQDTINCLYLALQK